MFKIYSSSAGSGKTYTLTKEYLKLALRPGEKDDYFRTILAVTFTNAAANEMKSRILERLADIAGRNESPLLDELVTELYGHQPGVDSPHSDAFTAAKNELRRRASDVFKTILHRYADFSVTTIDSFTQRVVTAFTDELGLPYSFEVEMDTDEVLELAIDNLIEKVGADQMDEITAILSEYYTNTVIEGKSWYQLPEVLKEFGRNLTSDQFYEAVSAAQELSPGAIRTIREQLLAHNQAVEAEIVAHGQRAWQRIADAGLDENHFTQTSKGIGAYFKGIAGGQTDKEVNSYHRKAVYENQWYAKKTHLTIAGAIDQLTDHLCDCFARIETVRSERGQHVQLFACLLPHLQKLALLKQMRIEFDDLLRRDGRVHISEFNKKILHIVTTEPVPFLYERLGTRYNHILIDEFQDTSRLQFANLLPLIENALGGNQFNLAVGDGKQAIYRFRGGDMDQIVALHRRDLAGLKAAHGANSWTADRIDRIGEHLRGELLDTNWRSAEPIVRFNNDFFDFTARRFEGTHPKLADVFDAAGTFRQRTQPAARPTGHVQLDFVAKDEDTGRDLTTQMLAQTITHLKQALADGYQYGDIAILCRKKAHARALANELNARRIPLVSADSLSLEFSHPVRWVVTLMRLLQQPDQKLLRYESLYLFHRVVRGVFPDDALTETLRQTAEGPIAGVYEYLSREGYPLDPYALGQLNPYELAERLTAQFGLFGQAEHNPFIFRFLDEVLTFNQKRSGHLSDFLRYWDGVRQKLSVEGDARNAVSIQTIHKAKGLEFPVVIIPFANWDVAPMTNGTMWLDLSAVETDVLTHAAPTGEPTRLLSAPVHPTSKLHETPDVTSVQFREEVMRTFLENMNLLYVAFTRPTDRLYVISEVKKDFGNPKAPTVAHWLYEFLAGSDVAQTGGCGWEAGKLSYAISRCAAPPKHRATGAPVEEIVLDEIVSGHRRQELGLRRQADRVFDVATFERTRERDRKLAAALSLMRGPDCLERALRQLVGEGLVRAAECDELRERIGAVVRHPDLAHLFDTSLRIDTDRSILSSRRLHGAPHRVVHYPDGRIVLVQYESATTANNDPVGSLRYFTDLYRQMGFAEVAGCLVYLSDEPRVIPVA